jgi:hypothetical protein
MASDLGTVRAALETALEGIDGLRVYGFVPKSAQPPFVFVDMPETVEFDSSMQRGFDRTENLAVVVCVADVVDRTTDAALMAYAASSGASSVKATLDGAAGESCRVTSVKFTPAIVAGTQYMAAIFTLDILF